MILRLRTAWKELWLHLLLGFGLFCNSVTIELRCYCNLPACLRTAYMCKSEIGCFQELPSLQVLQELPKTPGTGENSVSDKILGSVKMRSSPESLRIGCLELWPQDQDYDCVVPATSGEEHPPFSTAKPRDGAESGETQFLRCCMEDVCNYVHSSARRLEPELTISVVRKGKEATKKNLKLRRLRAKHLAALLGDDSASILIGTENEDPQTQSNQPKPVSEQSWFRWAVILVPIFGLLILLILIFSAYSMLKQDWQARDSDKLLVSAQEWDRPNSPNFIAFRPQEPNWAELDRRQPGWPSLRPYHSESTLLWTEKQGLNRPMTVVLN